MKKAEAAARSAPRGVPEKPHRGQILGSAFRLFIERGYAETSTSEIARAARVSKREVYALFGSKQALLATCIAERARSMRLPLELPKARDAQGLSAILTRFGAAVLRVVCDPTVTALYRLAMIEAKRSPEVAHALDASGRQANRMALTEVLAGAQSSGLLAAGEASAMAADFFALLWGDLQVRLLLGVTGPPTPLQIERRARAATRAFLLLHAKAEAGHRRSSARSRRPGGP